MSDRRPDNFVITPRVRLSFPHLMRPFVMKGSSDQTPKYSAMLIFDKAAVATPEFEAMRNLAREAVRAYWPGGVPAGRSLRNPFRSGKDRQGLKPLNGVGPDDVYINVSSRFQPEVIDQRKQPLLVESDVYAGCYVRASLGVYAY